MRPWWPTHHTVSEALVPATQQVPVHGGLPWGQSVMLGMADLISSPLCWFWELVWSLLWTLMHAWTFLVSVFYGSCLRALSAGLQSANINYFTSILLVSHIFPFYYNMTVESDLKFGSVLNMGPVTTCPFMVQVLKPAATHLYIAMAFACVKSCALKMSLETISIINC